MADAIERLYRLSVDATGAVAQLQKLNGSVDAAGARFDKLGTTLKQAGAALGGAFAVREVVAGIRSVVDSMDDIVKAAQSVGVAAESLQALRYAAEASGAGAETLDKGLQRLAANLQDVDAGTTSAAKALKAFGVTGADSTEAAFAKIAEGFAKLPDGAQKTAIALDVFGKAGAQLIPTLNNGSAGLAELTQEANDLGLVMSGPALKAAEHFGDQLDMLTNQTKASAQQFVSGMLPALQSIASVLIDARKGGDGFTSWGEAAGEVMVTIAQGAAFLSGAFTKLMVTFGALADVVASPLDAGRFFDAWSSELDAIDDRTSETALKLREQADAFKDSQKAFTGPPEPPKQLVVVKTAGAEAKKAIDLAAEAYKAFQSLVASDAREAGASLSAAEKAAKDAGAAFAKSPEGQRVKLWDEQTEAAEKYALTLGDTATQQQIWRQMLESGTEAQKAYAQESLNAGAATTVFVEETNKGRTELDAFSSGWDNFADALASGSVTVAEAFSGMVKSIIADLLKIWAQRFIIEAIFGKGAGTGGVKTQAFGGVFDRGQVVPFALGGIVSSPTHFRMAGARVGLMGEAGPEAIMPLARTGDGALGVRAAGGGALNVAIHNYTDASVSARRNSSGDLEVLIEQTKKAIAADFRRGGNDLARSAEGAWGLTRGAAAAF